MKFFIFTNALSKYKDKNASSFLKKPGDKPRNKILLSVEIIFFSLVLLLFVGVLFQFIASRADQNEYKGKGSMYSIKGYRLFVNSGGNGNGKYAVVFESDTGSAIGQWKGVKDSIDDTYRELSYDRAGIGFSDASTSNMDFEANVDNLRNVLKSTGTMGPYILVGHGYGGLIMTEYAKKYPKDIVGVILVDSLMEDDIKSKEFQQTLAKNIRNANIKKVASYFGGTRLAYDLGIFKDKEYFLNNLEEDDKGAFRAQRETGQYYGAFGDELKTLKNYNLNVQQKNSLSMPLIVMTPASKFNDASKDTAYIQQQKKLTELSSNSEQMVIEKSGSYIQVDRPDAFAVAIRNLIKKAGRQP
ncbi:alpha/beta hydrolase [Clostridium sp. 19966]|uniref:alpha/beta fold hydrolase n=1 Tax=Clostridium sp. 19966 TaxID=2768166 RepID=UPI0028E01241|nr:alpha/beta hydrolase [Clostridium sp. 19966]MDT8715515.1 alpha/beta hydrolase [Clostridium sp. 19966]